MRIIRWLLVIPSALAGWYLALLIGVFLYSVADYFCPPAEMISGLCVARWHGTVIEGLFVVGASLAAIFVVQFAVFTAPEKKTAVAISVFCLGMATAASFAFYSEAWGAFVGASTFGALTTLHVIYRIRKVSSA